LTTTKSNGLNLIKDILGRIKEGEIKYISAGKYSIKTESNDLKSTANILKEILLEIEKKAKKEGIDFNILEK
jgi:translation initiation factor 2 alpha subunit (eIF-2alpha)